MSVGTWVDFHTAAIVFQVFSDSVLVTECHMPREQGEDTEPKIRHACHLSQDFSGFSCQVACSSVPSIFFAHRVFSGLS